MSLNFYFKQKNADQVVEHMERIIQKSLLIDEETLTSISKPIKNVGTLHIGQLAVMNKYSALLRRNDKFYTTVNEMRDFYETHKDSIVIIDELGEVYSWQGLYDRFLSVKAEPRGKMDADGYCWMRGEFS